MVRKKEDAFVQLGKETRARGLDLKKTLERELRVATNRLIQIWTTQHGGFIFG
ncbi:hypothetical protein Csa_023736 [Cucumis sativus]|nr:hypothetical protein Csa_023736 [Cucumis sativus]